tara:strand:- start:120 stop:458 length:339 start_codon:yes stop_codon:yes gene_type:complete
MKKLLSIVVLSFFYSTVASADCYDDVEFKWKFLNNNLIKFEFLNNTNKRILIKEWGIKTSDNQIIKTNYGDYPASIFYVQLDKFGKSTRRLDISNVNSKFIKFGYFKCNYLQ